MSGGVGIEWWFAERKWWKKIPAYRPPFIFFFFVCRLITFSLFILFYATQCTKNPFTGTLTVQNVHRWILFMAHISRVIWFYQWMNQTQHLWHLTNSIKFLVKQRGFLCLQLTGVLLNVKAVLLLLIGKFYTHHLKQLFNCGLPLSGYNIFLLLFKGINRNGKTLRKPTKSWQKFDFWGRINMFF